jgi:protein-L-isoaspartate(D-aspartate) O-methyltransferase
MREAFSVASEENLMTGCKDARSSGVPIRTVLIVMLLLFVGITIGIIGFIVGQMSLTKQSLEGSSHGGVETAEARPNALPESSSAETTSDSKFPLMGNPDNNGQRYDLRKRTKHPPVAGKDEYVQWMLKNTTEEEKYVSWRWDLSEDLRSWMMITNDRMLEAFLLTPREDFCREWNLHKAYLDIWMNIGYGVTITDPSVVCRMTETILPDVDHRVLEIGTGSGYQAAILSNLSNYVYTIEIIEELAVETDQLYDTLEKEYPQYKNIRRKVDDGYYGWPEYAPFDRIIVTCSIDHIPPLLIKQLAFDGIMIIPVGPPGTQTLLKITKRVKEKGEISLERADVWGSPVTFVPFTDKSGKKHTLNE